MFDEKSYFRGSGREAVMRGQGRNGYFLVQRRLLSFLGCLHREDHAERLIAQGLDIMQAPTVPGGPDAERRHLVVRQSGSIAEIENHAGMVVRFVSGPRNGNEPFFLGEVFDDRMLYVRRAFPEQETEGR